MNEDESVLTRAAPAADEIVAYGEDPDQVVDIRDGSGDAQLRPLLVIVHGGFWRPQYGRDHTGPMASALAAAGWTTAAIEYRRIPGEPDASVMDVANALAHLPSRVRRHNGRVIAIGHSAGGHLALLAATAHATPSLLGALGLAPVVDLQLAHERGLGGGAVAAFLGAEPSARLDLDPRRRGAPAVKTVLLHGDRDAVVPLEISESYVAMHRDVELRCLADCGHFALIDPLSAAWLHVVSTLERLAA
ncbi:MAG: alpha/beta hydrolase [Myxococcaceae bacterium]|nr:alpha/beta hydrolase [Myxococcaceae bacterium]MCI0674096.1 alpha/beta hydrolase [Myxococcaceae bacterium]